MFLSKVSSFRIQEDNTDFHEVYILSAVIQVLYIKHSRAVNRHFSNQIPVLAMNI